MARFSAWRRSEGIISKATGVVWIILILVRNDREKETKQKQTRKKTSVSLRRWLRQNLPFRHVHDVDIIA